MKSREFSTKKALAKSVMLLSEKSQYYKLLRSKQIHIPDRFSMSVGAILYCSINWNLKLKAFYWTIGYRTYSSTANAVPLPFLREGSQPPCHEAGWHDRNHKFMEHS